MKKIAAATGEIKNSYQPAKLSKPFVFVSVCFVVKSLLEITLILSLNISYFMVIKVSNKAIYLLKQCHLSISKLPD